MICDLGPTKTYISIFNDRKDKIQRFMTKNNDCNERFNRGRHLTPGIRRQKMGETTNAFARYFSDLFIDANIYRTYWDGGGRSKMSTDSGKEKKNNVLVCHVINHKSYINCPAIELGPGGRKTRD
jgi:hypothetical protein